MSFRNPSPFGMVASLLLKILHEVRMPLARLTAGLLVLSIMSTAAGCASRPYPQPSGNGEGSAAIIYVVPLILANEIALYAIEKKKQTAAEARVAEELSQVRRFEELKVLSVKHEPAIQLELAYCYLRGRGAVRDLVRGVFWLHKSASQGSVEAQNELGLCYYNEIGVKHDKAEACAWWSLAAAAQAQAKASLDYVVADTEKHLTKEAFAEFTETVRRRAAQIKIQ